MQVLENFLPKSFHEDLTSVLSSFEFPWHYAEKTSREVNEYGDINIANFKDKNTLDCPQFVHMLFNDEPRLFSQYFESFKPIIYFVEEKTKIQPTNLYKIKANLMYSNPTFDSSKYNMPHWDWSCPKPSYTLLYYFNDADGDTIFFNETARTINGSLSVAHRITPKANSAVIFNAEQYHASTPPNLTERRMVLNVIFS
jgi:hypothetical protein